MCVSKAQVASSEASRKTMHRRTQQLGSHRDLVSGGESTVQLRDEVRAMSKEDRRALLLDGGFSIDVPPEYGLAMKADLALPWTKLRVVRRYTHEYIHQKCH